MLLLHLYLVIYCAVDDDRERENGARELEQEQQLRQEEKLLFHQQAEGLNSTLRPFWCH